MKSIVILIFSFFITTSAYGLSGESYFLPHEKGESAPDLLEYSCAQYTSALVNIISKRPRSKNGDEEINVMYASIWIHGYFSGRFNNAKIPLTLTSDETMVGFVVIVCNKQPELKFVDAVYKAAELFAIARKEASSN